MNDNARLDDELAALTDALLEGRQMETPPEQRDLEAVVRQLHKFIAPHEAPSPAFRARLEQRLNQEWNLAHRQRPERWYRRRGVQLLALAASAALILTVALLALPQNGGSALQGAAAGPVGWGLLLLLVVLIGVISVIIWYKKR